MEFNITEQMKKDFAEILEKSFVTDVEKMVDFFELEKDEFLDSYSYLTSEEYDCTKLIVAIVPLLNLYLTKIKKENEDEILFS